MSIYKRLFVVIAVVTLAFPTLLIAQNSDNASENPLRAADLAFAQATKERGLDGWMSFFADDAYVGTNPSVQGKLALRQFYQPIFSRRGLKFEWTPEHSVVFPSGIMGYTSGHYTMSFVNFQGKEISQTGNYLTVWHKQPDGSWKVLSDFGSQDKPPAELSPPAPKNQPQQ